MTTFQTTHSINAPVAAVWNLIGTNFGDLAAWAPMFVSASYLVEETPAVGGHRVCQLPRPVAGMTHIEEEIIGWEEGRRIEYRVLQPPKGVLRMKNEWIIKADGGRTLITLRPTFDLAPPLAGFKAWMGWRLQFKPLIRKAMKALEKAARRQMATLEAPL